MRVPAALARESVGCTTAVRVDCMDGMKESRTFVTNTFRIVPLVKKSPRINTKIRYGQKTSMDYLRAGMVPNKRGLGGLGGPTTWPS